MKIEEMVEIEKRIDELISRYPFKRAALIPSLHEIQNRYGYIPKEAEVYIAKKLELIPSKVREVITFYTLLLQKPIGKYHIQICSNISCSLLGSRKLSEYLQKKLKIKIGETTPDGKFTLSEVECLGYCENAPVMQINYDFYGSLTEESIDDILNGLD